MEPYKKLRLGKLPFNLFIGLIVDAGEVQILLVQIHVMAPLQLSGFGKHYSKNATLKLMPHQLAWFAYVVSLC